MEWWSFGVNFNVRGAEGDIEPFLRCLQRTDCSFLPKMISTIFIEEGVRSTNK